MATNTCNEKFTEQTIELIEQSSETVKRDHSVTNLMENWHNNGKIKKKLGIRHIQVINICMLIFVTYYTRNGLSLAIVAMNDRNSTINPNIPTFKWTNKNVVQSSFFFSYVPSQIIISFLITKFGTKWLSLVSMAFSSLFGLLIPTLAYNFEDKGVIVARILQGVAQGSVFPSAHYLLGRWVPANERARLVGGANTASTASTLMAMFVNGYIAGSWLGWPWIFYFSNILGFLWCLSFFLLSYDSPGEHPLISKNERKFIENNLGHENTEQNPKIPWKELATSVPFWALGLTHAGFSWGFWTLESQMPLYMKHVMKYDIKLSGTFAALPYLVQWALVYFFAFMSDYLLQKKVWTTGTARKTLNSIGMFLPAVMLILINTIGPDEPVKVVVLLTLAIGLNGACFCSFMVNYIDLSPKFASIMLGLSNGVGQATGFLAPLFVQAVVKNDADPNQWKYVFYMAAAIYFIAGLIFIFFGSGQVQHWNNANNIKCKKMAFNIKC